VMCALIAPDAGPVPRQSGRRWSKPGRMGHRSQPWRTAGWHHFRPARRQPLPAQWRRNGWARTQSAGTAQIARDSGGDNMSVNDASALEDTLARIRQRYTLYFNLPEGVQPGQERNIQVDLTPEARQRYRDAEVRRTFMSSAGGRETDRLVSRARLATTATLLHPLRALTRTPRQSPAAASRSTKTVRPSQCQPPTTHPPRVRESRSHATANG
jgi:hypothetical protein